MSKILGSFNKWVFLSSLILLYALVVLVALLTHQPQETMNILLEGGAVAVGVLCWLVLMVG